ncbi:MAG: SixA phosphatase family protein [Pseudomonadota bacterium]
MDLILWRHAEAEDGVPDLARQLTPKGEKQAKRVAQWLLPRLPEDTRVIASPAKRALQTAAALGLDFVTMPALAPGAPPASVLEAAGWPEQGGSVLAVGHQPTFGQLVAGLVGGRDAEWSIKKGGLWWLRLHRRGGADEVVVRAVIAPDLVRP